MPRRLERFSLMRPLLALGLLLAWAAVAWAAPLAPVRTATALAFAPDGRLVAGYSDGTIEIWTLQPDTMIRRWATRGGAVKALTVSRDGRQVASAGADHSVRVWDASGNSVAALAGGEAPMAMRADGIVLTCRPTGRGLTSWRLAARGAQRLGTLLAGQLIQAVDAGGTCVATADGNWVVRLWQLDAGLRPRLLHAVKSQGWGGISGVGFSGDGSLLSVLGSTISKPPDAFSRMFSVRSGKEVGYHVVGTNIWASAISADNHTLALVGTVEGGAALAVFDLSIDKRLWSLDMFTPDPPAKLGDVRLLALSPQGDLLATAGPDEPLRIWDARHGTLKSTLVP